MRVLITGASGLAGGWLCRACLAAGDSVVGLSRRGTAPEGVETVAVDLRNSDDVMRTIRAARPEVVYHLAALSAVGESWRDPRAAIDHNAGGSASLLEAVRAHTPGARVVWVSSSEVYGTAARSPIDERSPPSPESPYAVSKLAAEQLALVYAHAYDLRVVVARSFAHSGPEQRPTFLISNLAWQAVGARRAGERSLRLATGRAETRRDVTDVRDVARAYRMLAADPQLRGIYTFCSGTTRSTAEQVGELARQVEAWLRVEHVVDPALVRATEVHELRGDPGRLRADTGWTPEVPYARTVADLLEYWERERP